jgi:sugar-phosphatase
MDWNGEKIKAVLFDMDGVLIDSEPLWKIALVNVFKSLGFELEPMQFAKTVGLRIDQVVAYWRSVYPWENRSNDEVVNDILDEVCRLIREKGEPLLGAFEVIAFLKEKDYPVALGTSSYKQVIETVLDVLNLEKAFDFVRSAQDEPYGKPHPGVYLSCAAALGVDPQNCVVIEDSHNGLLSAKAARMKTILVPGKIHLPHPYYVLGDAKFDNLLEVREFFKGLMH